MSFRTFINSWCMILYNFFQLVNTVYPCVFLILFLLEGGCHIGAYSVQLDQVLWVNLEISYLHSTLEKGNMFDEYILIKMITVIQVLLSHQINSLLSDAGRSTSSAFLPFFPVCRGLPCPSVSHQTVHSLQTSGEETGNKCWPICLLMDFLLLGDSRFPCDPDNSSTGSYHLFLYWGLYKSCIGSHAVLGDSGLGWEYEVGYQLLFGTY